MLRRYLELDSITVMLYVGLGLFVQLSAVMAHSFIVQLAGNTSMSTVISDYSLQVKSGDVEAIALGGRFRALMGEFSADVLRKLHRDPRVAAISIDRWLELQEYVIQGQSPMHLCRLASSSTSVHRPFMFDSHSGGGVDMYLFDTGIDFKHPGLSNVDVRRLDDFSDSSVPEGCDPHGHGTALAGLIASETFGVLKRCDLLDVRVADEQGRVKISNLLRGLGLATAHASKSMKPSVFVIPMVAGVKNYVLRTALEAIPSDIAVVLPAGNQQSEACDFCLLDKRKVANVLVVGSADDKNRIASFSNYGDCVDVYTSGVGVRTLQSTDLNPRSLLTSINGTSASCAIGAGVVGYYMSMGLRSNEAVEKIHQVSEEVSKYPHYCKLLQLKP
ncbi:hypothetical protein HG536_0B00970 [Torulaspora globosa]|uniref:Peptidase S8/S53 domain-containing protein n=1 Tax=Torulaspora globosa TaxID=48254 RepID=A0A7G3ZCK0_9SACH|nr:uncharacterized protein HG536_0B00970 [Torulaspora globosa]QLL31236.1 hypothetical protein HG536_0B00970 [Torulaspora globosa]